MVGASEMGCTTERQNVIEKVKELQEPVVGSVKVN
jgi:hypothetical protein